MENKRSGWGRMTYENGDVYEGEWLKDKPHGQGVLWLGKIFHKTLSPSRFYY